MEARVIGYSVTLDPALWIDVPLSFPSEQFATAEEWAVGVAEHGSRDMPDPLAKQLWLYLMAKKATELRVDAAERRFWYFPIHAEMVSVAHLYAGTRSEIGPVTLEEVVGANEPSVTYPVLEEFPSPRFGRIVRGLSTETVNEEEGGSHVAGRARIAGEQDGRVFLLEVIDRNLSTVALMLDDLMVLFESIEVGELP